MWQNTTEIYIWHDGFSPWSLGHIIEQVGQGRTWRQRACQEGKLLPWQWLGRTLRKIHNSKVQPQWLTCSSESHPLVSATYQQSLKKLLHPWIIHWWVQSLMSQSPSKELTAEHCCLGSPDFNAWGIRGHFKSKANLLLFLILFKDIFLSVCLYIIDTLVTYVINILMCMHFFLLVKL